MAKKSKKKSSSNNIRVVVRARPLLDFERERGKVTCIVKAVDDSIIQVDAPTGNRYFELDAAMCGAQYSHEDIYAKSGAKNAVTNDIFKGFNCTILAYGQTGSGIANCGNSTSILALAILTFAFWLRSLSFRKNVFDGNSFYW